jgi:hypothetical protein
MILLPPPTRLLVSTFGLDPDKDVSYAQVGDVPVLMAALTAGNKTIDGAIIQPPYYQKLVASGVRVLANMQEMDISFQQAGLNTTQKFVAKSRCRAPQGDMEMYAEEKPIGVSPRRIRFVPFVTTSFVVSS